MNDDFPRNSWSDFYESYDGKFDERNMLHITVHSDYRKEIELLGYKLQDKEDAWHKPNEGEYKFSSEGNLVIIHSCPDREIFNIDIIEFLEDLMINEEWTTSVELSVM
tara:strand:- start:1651 stop:1974 length:324 start_codon:yes stop_codon:yes gene_type:complete